MPDEMGGHGGWIDQARRGDRETLGRALEDCRDYLLLVANRELDPELRAKGGASDLVQETFLEAQRDFSHFQGDDPGAWRAWLRQILLRRLGHHGRRYRGTGKRQVGREVSLDQREAPRLAADMPTPGAIAERHEEEAALRAALERLPAHFRSVIQWRHRERSDFKEIGRRLGCSEAAARKTWARAVERLRHELGTAT